MSATPPNGVAGLPVAFPEGYLVDAVVDNGMRGSDGEPIQESIETKPKREPHQIVVANKLKQEEQVKKIILL